MPFDANYFRKPTRPPVLEFALLLKDEVFLMGPEVGLSDVLTKTDCGYTCSEELNIMLAIAMLVSPISLWSLLSLPLIIPRVLG